MKNMMYHLIGGKSSLKGLPLKKYIKQISDIKKNYGLSNVNFTFDHGTLDHYLYAAPQLEKIGAKGVFFILSGIPENSEIPIEDKQRRIESFSRKTLAKKLCYEFNINYKPTIAKNYLKRFKFYSLEERYLRYLRNEKINKKNYEKFISEAYKKKFADDIKYIKKNYMSWKHIKELSNRGHIIGSHSHLHYGDKKDFKMSIQIIEKKIKKKVDQVSYPNGKKIISDRDLNSLGVKFGYSTNVSKNKNKFRLPRIDCNQFKK